MAVIASALKHMLAAGMAPDDIVAAVADMEAAMPQDAQAERRRAKDRERKRLRNSAESAEVAETVSPKEKSPTPPKEITPSAALIGAGVETRIPEMLAALGVTDETKSPGLLSLSEPIRWVEGGCDVDADILPALRVIGAKGRRPNSWGYCSNAVFEARDKRLVPAPAPQQRAPPSASSKPRNVGESARLELIRRGEYPNVAQISARRDNESDRNTGFAGTDIARQIALAADGRR